MRKIIKHHIEEGTRESHPRVQDLQHPRLGKPRRGLQILDTRMGFPRPPLNVVLDSINLIVKNYTSNFVNDVFWWNIADEYEITGQGKSYRCMNQQFSFDIT